MPVDISSIVPMSVAEQADATSNLVRRSITDSSNATYVSARNTLAKMITKIRGLNEALVERDLLTATKIEMLEVFNILAEQKVGCGGTFLAALKKLAAQHSASQSMKWLYDADVQSSAKAVKRIAKEQKKPCGTLTVEQFDGLRTYLSSNDEMEEFYAVTVGFRGRLRIGELGPIEYPDLTEEGGFSFLILRENKIEQYDSEKKLVPSSLRAVFDMCKQRWPNHPENRLFGPNIDGRLRTKFPVWAVALGWSTALHWGGPHVLRHGGTAALDALRMNIADAVYAESASDRIKRSRE